MLVATLIGAMISIVVGVTLIPTIVETINTATPALEASGNSGLVGLLNVLPYVFVAVILLGAVAWIGGPSSLGDGEKIKTLKNPKDLMLLMKGASKDLALYMNNLDALLGIKTVVDREGITSGGLRLSKENDLFISDDYDWYLVDKHPDMNMFKVVGLHKDDAAMNTVYILGKNEKPYLIRMSRRYLDTDPSWRADKQLAKVT